MSHVRQIAGENLTDSELTELAEQLLARARAIRAERYGMTADEAVEKALKEFNEKTLTESMLKKRNTLKINEAFSNALGYIQTAWADSPRDGLSAFLIGSNTARRGAQKSVDADKHGLANAWLNGFDADIEKTGKKNLWARGDLDQDTYRALGEMDKDDPNYQGIDRDAREFAAVIYRWQQIARVNMNNAGAWIGKITDYITHQNHDMFKVRNSARILGVQRGIRSYFTYNDDVNFAAWRDFILPRLDQERTFEGVPDERREGWLRTVWLAIASGDHQQGLTTVNGFTGGGSLGAKVSEPRLMHFKDADARFEYDQTFGRGGSLFERASHQLIYSAHATAIMRRLSPNPDEVFNRLMNGVRLLTEANVQSRLATKWGNDELVLRAYFDDIMGRAQTPGTTPLATALRTARMAQVLSKLGSAMISSFADTAVAAAELRYQGFSAPEAWKVQLDGLFQGYGKRGQVRAGRMQLASELGVAIDVLKSATYSRFSASDALPGWAARAQHYFYQLNGLTWWTDTLRLANAQAMSHRIAMNIGKGLSELDADAQRLFKLFDISGDEWDLMRGRSTSVVEGKEFFSPQGASNITDAEIAYLLKAENPNGSINNAKVRQRRELIESKFRDLFASRAEYAIITPGAKTRSYMAGTRFGAQPGTLISEIVKSISQFKGFPGAIIEKVWGRELFGYGETGLAKDTNATGMSRLAGFMVYSTMIGFVSLYAKAYFNGRRLEIPQNPQDAGSLMLAAFLQGGGAGLYGDFLVGQGRDRFGHSALSSMAGPAWGMAEDTYSGLRAAIKSPFDWMFEKAKEGDGNAGGTFNAFVNNMPFLNIFYTRMALNYLFLYRLQEWMSPGSLKRMEDNYKKNMNQSFKLPPSQNYRAEDLSVEDIGTLLNPR